jgi:hypothetical protein
MAAKQGHQSDSDDSSIVSEESEMKQLRESNDGSIIEEDTGMKAGETNYSDDQSMISSNTQTISVLNKQITPNRQSSGIQESILGSTSKYSP